MISEWIIGDPQQVTFANEKELVCLKHAYLTRDQAVPTLYGFPSYLNWAMAESVLDHEQEKN